MSRIDDTLHRGDSRLQKSDACDQSFVVRVKLGRGRERTDPRLKMARRDTVHDERQAAQVRMRVDHAGHQHAGDVDDAVEFPASV